LTKVACDPLTISPLRVAEPGTWWDEQTAGLPADLPDLERELDAVDGRRIALQREARARLQARGLPLTRTTVLREATALLKQPPT